MRKWLQIGSLIGWEIGDVVLEDLQLTGMIESVRPISSAERQENEVGRFRYREYSDSLVEFWAALKAYSHYPLPRSQRSSATSITGSQSPRPLTALRKYL